MVKNVMVNDLEALPEGGACSTLVELVALCGRGDTTLYVCMYCI